MQPDLFQPEPTKATPYEISHLLRLLDAKGWQTAAQVCGWAAYDGLDWTDRKIRQIANASAGRVISGQRGYKLTSQASEEEVHHAAAWLRHQSSEMTHRANEIDRAYQSVRA